MCNVQCAGLCAIKMQRMKNPPLWLGYENLSSMTMRNGQTMADYVCVCVDERERALARVRVQ